MIKKYVLWFILAFLTFFGLKVGAVGVTTLVWIDSFTSPVNSWYTLTALKWWGVLTNFLWVWKGVLALDSQRLFWRTPNWYPYAYLKWQNGTVQWFFDRYYSCDLIDIGSPSNCTEVLIDYSWWSSSFDSQVFTTFFDTVTAWQKFYVFSDDYRYIGATYDQIRNAIDICWNSENIWHSFCFKWWSCYWSNWWRPSDCDFWNLVYSQAYDDLKFSNISLRSIWPAPWQAWYWLTWWDSESDLNVITVSDNDIVNYYENVYWFNSNMCYVSTTDLDSEYWQIWQTSSSWQSSIFQAFSHLYNRLPASDWYTIIWRWIDFWIFNYNNWFNTDQNPPFLLIGSPLAELWEKTYTWFVSPFIWQPAFIYFYVNELEHEGSLSFWTERYGPLIAQYCDIKLNWTNSYPLLDSSVNDIKEEKSGWWNYWEDWEYQSPTQWYNWWSSWFWDNTATATWTVAFNTSFKQFYANLSDMLSWISVPWNWIIPNYILFFLAFIILVRLFRK